MSRVFNVPAWIATGGFVILGVVMAWVGLEAILLWTGQAPITWWVVCLGHAYNLPTAFAAFVIGSLVTGVAAHFWWHAR